MITTIFYDRKQNMVIIRNGRRSSMVNYRPTDSSRSRIAQLVAIGHWVIDYESDVLVIYVLAKGE